MFWKKKHITATSVETATVPADDAMVNTNVGKLPGAQKIPRLVAKYLIDEKTQDIDWVNHLKAVVRNRAQGADVLDIRVYDETLTSKKKINIKDYTTFESHLEEVLFEGWYNPKKEIVELEDKRSGDIFNVVVKKDKIYTEDEIWQRIVNLKEPGNSVFFYLSISPVTGGPLGNGAVIIELNGKKPGQSADKFKRYSMYLANVEGDELATNREKTCDFKKSKEIAKWIKERHFKKST